MADAPKIETFGDRETLHDAAAELLMDALGEAVAADGRTAFAASGGTTPAPVYLRMAGCDAAWAAIHVTLTDERWAPPTSAQSNQGLLHRTLLTGQAAAAPFTPLWSEAPSPQAAAEEADGRLAGLPPFGAVLIGMGADGHIASLFPGSPALAQALEPQSRRRVVAVPPATPAPEIWRLSLTLAALLRSELILLLITGEEKHALLKSEPPVDLPVHALLRHASSALRIFWAP